ncbi:leucine-rich repeat-containing protein 15-like [Elysia marginata]|uniref:Leucine-rich repeat-containing protein 15-like n=1 Tax=Elysia marginata TaxID=1093978 RepID=A0AAV4GUB5_9GAST|nr:leucine-rich repeat-containing protein 15-like [Elysia marginata]
MASVVAKKHRSGLTCAVWWLVLAVVILPRVSEAVTAFCHPLKEAFAASNCECRGARGPDGKETLDVVLDCSDQAITSVPAMASGTDPTTLPVIHEFILANNSITRLNSDSFTGLRVRALDLSGNSIGYVADDAFFPLMDTIRELKMDGDQSSGPPKPAFAFLGDLEVLALGNYRVAYLGDSDHQYFLATPNLKHLTIHSWSIQAVERDAFTGMNDLQSLTILNEKEINNLPTQTLRVDSLKNLKRLKISTTSIDELPYEAFSSLTNLEELDLSDNFITKITFNSLDGLGRKLKKLSFASNILRSDTSDFSGLRNLENLEELDLSGNEKITSIPNLSNLNLGDQTSLKIFLGSNEITSLSASAFSGIEQQLHTLDLSGNSIPSIAKETFSGVTRLQELRLSSQSGQTGSTFALPSSLTQSAGSLTHLFLDGLKLDTAALWAVLPQMTKLEVLDLSHTQLSGLQNLAFENLTSLQELNLNGNRLISLDQEHIVGPRSSLKKLYLSNNPLKRISSCVFAHYDSFPITLALQSAPLECDCRLGWLYKAEQTRNIRFLDGKEPTCANMNNVPLMSKSYADVCADGNYIDPPCENPYTTPAPPTTPGPPTLTLKVMQRTNTSITLSWTLSSTAATLTKFAVTVTNNYGQKEYREDDIPPRVSQLEAKPLLPGTSHKVCVIANFLDINSVTTCTFTNTEGDASPPKGQTGDSDSNNAGIIIGAVVGAILLLVVLAAIFYLAVIRRRPKKGAGSVPAPIQPRNFAKSELPSMTEDSRRFTRPKRPLDNHDGMQVVAISDGQMSDRNASNGSAARVGRAAMLNSDGSYKLMSAGPSSLARTSVTSNTSGGPSLYENDRGLLPKTPPYNNYGLRGPRQPGYYNEAFETDKYDEIDMQREVTL